MTLCITLSIHYTTAFRAMLHVLYASGEVHSGPHMCMTLSSPIWAIYGTEAQNQYSRHTSLHLALPVWAGSKQVYHVLPVSFNRVRHVNNVMSIRQCHVNQTCQHDIVYTTHNVMTMSFCHDPAVAEDAPRGPGTVPTLCHSVCL